MHTILYDNIVKYYSFKHVLQYTPHKRSRSALCVLKKDGNVDIYPIYSCKFPMAKKYFINRAPNENMNADFVFISIMFSFLCQSSAT